MALEKITFDNQLIDQVLAGRRRAIARLITLVENDPQSAREGIQALYQRTGQAHIIGVTGPPGSGKSTLVNEMAKAFRRQELLVGIVAVDPSSPFTGGALLGDRVRMRDLAGDQGIFIRSMASRGSLGGLARTTNNVVKVLDAAGFEVILIETVGAGQAEVDIAATAHTTVVIETPGMGDEIQTIKAGILEIADILVVNKADRPGSDRTVKALEAMLHMGSSSSSVSHHGFQVDPVENEADLAWKTEGWRVPVLPTIGIEGTGTEWLIEKIMAHKEHLQASGEWRQRELARSRQEINLLIQAAFLEKMRTRVPEVEREALIAAVADRQMDPYTAVAHLFSQTAEPA